MKLRGVAIVVLIALVFIGSVVYGAHRFTNRAATLTPEPAPASKEDAFLDEVRQKAQQVPPTQGVGTLPPVNGDPSLVPAISVEPAALDMGVVAREGMANGELKVLNKGKGVLQITQVSTSCGCTKAHIADDKKSIPPGGESVVTVSIDPKRIPGFESTKTVTITSNDPQQQRVNVQVTAKIDPEFELDPKELSLGEVEKGTPIEKTMVFRQLQPEPLEILEVSPTSKAADMDISFVKRPEGEWASPQHPEYLITVRIPDDVSPGPFDGRFTIKTTCKRLPSYMSTVRANIKAFYNISPARQLIVRAGTQPGQAGGAASATVTGDRPFEITDLKTTGEDLTVASKLGEMPNSVLIDVGLKPEAEPGQRNETVSFVIKTGDQSYKERISVRVYAARPGVPVKPMPTTPTAKIGGAPPTPQEEAFRKLREMRRPPSAARAQGGLIPQPQPPQAAVPTPVPPEPPKPPEVTPPVPPQPPVAPQPVATPVPTSK